MSLMITDGCIACDTCREECSSYATEEGDPIYMIDPDRCTKCVGHYEEPQCVEVCLADCIIIDPDNEETMEELEFEYEQLIEEKN